MNHPSRLALSVLAVALAGIAMPAENRLYLVNFAEPWANRGFRVELVNRGEGDKLLSVDGLKLLVGVGDGKTYREAEVSAKFSPTGTYTLKAVISPTEARLYVDGKAVLESKGGFVPARSSSGTVGETYKWLASRTDYLLQVDRYTVKSEGGQISGTMRTRLDSPLAPYEFDLPLSVALTVPPGGTVTCEAQIRLAPIPANAYLGAIDKYGQVAAADWPGKVRTDADLTTSTREEADRAKDWAWPGDWDAYGGLKTAGWREKATGFFRMVKRDGVWWLITPEGNPVFYTGLCTAPATKWETTPVTGREDFWQELPPKDGLTASLWQTVSPWNGQPVDAFAQHSWNLVRKFGPDWEAESVKEFARRSAGWGFSGQGKFGDPVPGVSRIGTLGLWGVPKLVRHVDIFDPAAVAAMRKALTDQTAPYRSDPRIVGFSIGNEYEEIFTPDEIRTILKDKKDSPTAKAIRERVKLSDPPTDEEIEAARRFTADAYYAFLYKTMKELAPNHLYFGFWITPGWWVNESDWDMLVKHCDVVGYDLYHARYAGDGGLTKRLLAKLDKPSFVGEFGFPAWYDGERGFGRYSIFAKDDADAGRLYALHIADAASDPNCVGATYFQYRDEPVTGRGPGTGRDIAAGERFAFGFVDITDRPKWDVVLPAREANLRATRDRLKLKG